MPNLSNFELVVAILVLAIPVILIPAVPRRWLWWTILLWAVAPFLGYATLFAWEASTRPDTVNTPGNALYGFMLISSVLTPFWVVICLIGIGSGLLLRRIFRWDVPPAVPMSPARPAPPPTPRAPPQPPPVAVAGWRSIHVGFAKDGLVIAGNDVWAWTWRPTGETVHLPHPAHPGEIHRYGVQEIGSTATPTRFAAGELSNGVWGFYIPTVETEMARGSSANGAIRYEYSLGEMVGHRYDTIAAWAVVLDGATGGVLADGAAWFRSRVIPQPDGSLFLYLSVSGTDALFRLDPITMRFRDLAAGGPDRPLAELAAAVEQARIAAQRPLPVMTRISPDGTVRVEIAAVEWSNSHWVHSPRVIDVPTGRIVLDLWNTDWDATVEFRGPRRVWLGFRRYHGGGAFSAELDLARGTWRITSTPDQAEAPLEGLVEGLEAAFREAWSGGRWIGPAAPSLIEPKRWAAWRTALMILVGSAVAVTAIGVVAYQKEQNERAQRKPMLDTVPRFEPPPPRPPPMRP